jgi:hypothetical protein
LLLFDVGQEGGVLLVPFFSHLAGEGCTFAPRGRCCDPGDGLAVSLVDLSRHPLQVFLCPGVMGQGDEAIANLGDAKVLEPPPDLDARR